MTSRNSFLAKKSVRKYRVYHMDLLSRRLWIGVLSLILQVIMYSVATPLRILYERTQSASLLTTEAARIAYQESQAQTIFGQMCLSTTAMLLTTFLAAVLAHQGFAYVFSRRELDFYMSQPVKRIHHFRDVYVNGVLLFAIPYIFSVGIGVLVAIGMNSMTTQVFCEILYGVVRMIVYFLTYYSISIIAVLTTGREIYAILMNLFFMGMEVVVKVLVSFLRQMYFATAFSSSDSIIDMGTLYFSPMYNFYHGRVKILNLLSYTGAVDSGKEILRVDHADMVYMILLAAVALLLAVFTFTMRRSEHAGTGICFRPVAFLVKAHCGIVGSLLVGIALDQILSGAAWITRTWIILLAIIAIALLITCFAEALLSRDIMRFFSGWKCTAITCAAAVLILISYRWDVFGYDRYLPNAEDVESYGIALESPINYRNYDYLNTSYTDATLYGLNMGLTDVDAMLTVAELGRENLVAFEKEGEDVEYGWYAVVRWNLKNGRTVTREIRIPYSIDGELMDRITGTEEYREYAYRVDEMAALSGVNGLNLSYNVGYDSVSANNANYMVQEFMQAYAADLTQYSFTFARDNESIGSINWWSTGTDVYYEVYPSYTNTIAFLRRYDLYLNPTPTLDQVASMTIEKYTYREDGMDSSYEKVEIEDLAEVEEILSLLYNSSNSGEWGEDMYTLYSDEGWITDYDVMLTIQNQGVTMSNSVWLEFKDDVPDWIVERF